MKAIELELVYLLLPLLALFSASSAPTFSDDVLGLIVFRADLHDPHSKLSSWNENDNIPCSWAGVQCDSKTNRVKSLTLDGFSLSGKLGRGLLRLQFLETLSLAKNNFTGSLIPELLSLESLKTLDLSENYFSGTFTENFFGKCKSIRTISLARNALSGAVPENVGSCSTLAMLNLSSNQLSGSLPRGIWGLNALRSLDLSDNHLVGNIPFGISKMFNLRSISLQKNRLTGQLPNDTGDCLLLESIDFSENMLSGRLPDSMRKLTICTDLRLHLNSFSGELPTWIGELQALVTLDLSNNKFIGSLPSSLSNLLSIRELNLYRNGLLGSLPDSLAASENLFNVDFSQNMFTGELPSWVFNSGMKTVSLAGNKMSGTVQIPPVNASTLEALDLSENVLTGEIPTEVSHLTNIKLLKLASNLLTGSIPASVGALKYLEVLDLSENSLDGEIPAEVGSCSSLASLDLSSNNLSGPIPATLANLTNLQTVDFSSNRLTGTIPKNFSDLGHLVSFNISHNQLSGDLPAGNFFNTMSPSFLADNPGLCGSIVNRSCLSVLPKPIVMNPEDSSIDPTSNPIDSPSTIRHKKILLSISVLVAISAAAIIAIGIATVSFLNYRVRTSLATSAAALALSDGYVSHSPDGNSGKLVMFSGNDPEFSAGVLAVLDKDCELGRGGFGAVYKTALPDGRPVAIKRLTVSSLVKSQDDFEKEIRRLGKMQHPNLVSLEGYYWTPSLQLLIYEFVPGGILNSRLHENDSSSFLTWQERFNIILGVAKSLAYLHRLNVIHYNVKSSNVILGSSGVAKVGDYGLAMLLPMLDRYVLSSKVQSALGYMAPEFSSQTATITEKCDVYGFGVLLLEIVTGKKPVEYEEEDVVLLCDTVREAMESNRMEDCMDGSFSGKFSVDETVPVIKLGLICTSQVPSSRPSMAEVVNILELIRCPPDSPEGELC